MADLFGKEKPIVPRDLLSVYDAEYRKRFDCAAPIVGKKDAPLAARLLKLYPFDKLSSWVQIYFDVPDRFIQESGFTFGVFSSCIAKVIQYDRRVAAKPTPPLHDDQYQLALRARKRADEDSRLNALDRAADYYRKHPWAKR